MRISTMDPSDPRVIQAIQHIRVMRAFLFGKTIQERSLGLIWYDVKTPEWDFEHCDYRIKHEYVTTEGEYCGIEPEQKAHRRYTKNQAATRRHRHTDSGGGASSGEKP